MADPFFHGPCTISDVQIYNRPLNASEVQQLYVDLNDPGIYKYNWQASSDRRSLALSWPSDTNYTYTILHADTPVSIGWLPVTSLMDLSATPPFNCSTVHVDWAESGFYRVDARLRNH
jgi:hypothetical protein